MGRLTDINKLTVAEKLQMLDQVWESLLCQDAEVPSPQWHEAVLDNRLSDVESGDLKFKSLDEVKSELRSEIK